MAWIEVVGESEAEGELRDLYEEVRRKRGGVASVYKVHSLHPRTMKDHMELYLTLMYGGSPLSRAQREMIAVVVSAANGCPYCVTHHSEALAVHLKDAAVRQAVATDHRKAAIPAKDRAMLDYAAKLTRETRSMSRADVEALRAAGWTDREILDINLIASYFNFVNRVVSGLGVDVEPETERTYRY